jgi:hypothetical protein
MNESCPINTGRSINEQAARLNALLTLVLVILFIVFYQPLIVVLLALDFFIRGFSRPEYSVLSAVSVRALKLLHIMPRPVNAGPKIFAAKIGFIFTAAVLISAYIGFKPTALIISCVLAVCAFLEAFFGYCVGCRFYSVYTKIFKTRDR